MSFHFSLTRLVLITAVLVLSFCVGSGYLLAQPADSGSSEETAFQKADPLRSRPTEPRKPLTDPVVQRIGVTSGFGSFIPNRWGILSAEVWNPTEQTQNLTIKANWETDTPAHNAVQFTRSFSVPAMTRRIIWYPIRVPDHEPENPRLKIGRLILRSIISREEDGKEVMVLSPLKKILDAAQINTEFNKPAMGYIPEDESARLKISEHHSIRGVDIEDVDTNTLKMLTTIRLSQGLGRQLFKPKLSGISPNPLSLDALDQLVIADGRYSKDVSLTSSIRSWLLGGGRAWIMLDRTGTAFAQRLLGDSLSLVELETQELNRIEIATVERGKHYVSPPVEFDSPVPLMNVLVQGVEVTHEVNGIPAAFWMKYGNGEILFTTLASEAWTRPKAPAFVSTELIALEPLQELMDRFFQPTEKALLDYSITDLEIAEMTVKTNDDSKTSGDKKQRFAEFNATSKVKDIDEFLKQKIGYQIVSRRHIMLVFGLFCASILGFGFYLHRKGRLELLLVAAPVVVMVLSSYLYIIGAVKRSGLENLTASVQFISAEHGSRDIVIRGIGAVYNEDSLQDDIQVTNGGVFWPDMQGLMGSNIRMVWTDMDRWHWEGLTIPGGTVRTFPFEKPMHLKEPIHATASLSVDGLAGTYHLPGFQNLEHAILVSPTGKRAQVDLENGVLKVHNGQLSESQLDSDTTLLDDEATRRLRFIQSLLNRDKNRLVSFPTRFTLLVWSSPLDLDFAFPGGQQEKGSALTAIPLRVQAMKPGQKFMVPSIYQQYDALNSTGLGSALAYDNENQKWFRDPRNSQNLFWLRAKVPPSVLPATITRATVLLDISAGGRPVKSVGATFDENGRLVPEVIETKQSPNTVVEFIYDDPRHLQVDEDGNLFLGINISLQKIDGETIDAMRARDEDLPWFIRDVDITLEGETLSHP